MSAFIVRGRNQAFSCEKCGAKVLPHPSSVRSHCPKCLWSKHVDVDPGDRSAVCGGLMQPVGLEKHRKGFRIRHSCQTCGEEQPCIAAPDDDLGVLTENLTSG